MDEDWRFKYIELDVLPVNDYKYIKDKIRTYCDKVYTNFHGLNVPEDGAECWSFTIGSLLVFENRYYLQAFLDNCDYKNINSW